MLHEHTGYREQYNIVYRYLSEPESLAVRLQRRAQLIISVASNDAFSVS